MIARRWLLLCLGLAAVVVALGPLTLTDSTDAVAHAAAPVADATHRSAGSDAGQTAGPGDADEPTGDRTDDDGSGADGAVGDRRADNEFWPENADIGDCLGALQRPGCGSEARGGWRQVLTFGVLVVALAIVAWRITVQVRRRSGPPDTGARRSTPTDGGDDDRSGFAGSDDQDGAGDDATSAGGNPPRADASGDVSSGS